MQSAMLHSNIMPGGFMRRTWMSFGLALLMTFLLTGGVQAISIFVWQHDNNQRVPDPVLRSNLTVTESVTRTLDALDIEFDTDRDLPDNLGQYDVVITCLSFYCPG